MYFSSPDVITTTSSSGLTVTCSQTTTSVTSTDVVMSTTIKTQPLTISVPGMIVKCTVIVKKCLLNESEKNFENLQVIFVKTRVFLLIRIEI